MKVKAAFPLLLSLSLILHVQITHSYPDKGTEGRRDSKEEDSELESGKDEDGIQRSLQEKQLPLPSFQEQLTNVCLQPKQIGKCKLFLPRYFFNAEAGDCELFAFGGCGGNENNFHSLLDCENRCSAANLASLGDEIQMIEKEPEMETQICELPPTSPGQNCRAYLPRWTYDAQERRCIQFIYSGCGATPNMYLRKFECQQKCGNYEPNVTEVRSPLPSPVPAGVLSSTIDSNSTGIRSRICGLPLDTGSCFATTKRYYFNRDSNRCLSFTFNGCGGNDNNFQSGDECLRTCGGSTPAENVACSHVSCPMNLYTHYTSLGCEPIYDGNACCPTRFDCGQRQGGNNQSLEITEVPQPKCQYKGKLYSVGQDVGEASSTSACRAACRCANYGGTPRINCASIECPETFGARPPGKENCTLLYRKGGCCAHEYYCAKDSGLEETDAMWIQQPEVSSQQLIPPVGTFRCLYEGKEYVEGERIEAKEDMCRSCICQKGFNGTLSEEFCEPIDCGIEIYYADQLEKGCAPVYYQDAENRIKCCPIGWECPGEQQPIVTPRSSSSVPQPGAPNPRISSTPFRPMNIPRSQLATTLDEGIVTTDACHLPRDIGPCKGARPRYYFNPLSATCEPFTFGGCGGNRNNFVALKDCQRVCGTSTLQSPKARPNTPLSRSSSTGIESKTHELSQVDACTLPPQLGPCRGYFRRFYYSPELDDCRSFVYGGCRGNQNNFYTMEACAAFCQNKILAEYSKADDTEEVTTPSGNTTGWARGSPIPVTDITNMQEPQNTRIEITREDPCNLPLDKGPCLAILPRFYYDPISATCKQFVYGGCGGNANNFVRIKDCEMRCSPKKTLTPTPGLELDSKMKMALGIPLVRVNNIQVTRRSGFFERCHLPKDSGSCRARIPSFYYDVESGLCQHFLYGGCFGNANRFSTLSECESICKSPEIQTISTGMQDQVKPAATPTIRRVLPDSQLDQNQRQQVENGTQEEICSLPVQAGDCRAHKLRFYWNPDLVQCLPFVYSGCGANRNNFLSESDCLSACAQEPPIERITQEGALTCSFGNETFPIGGVLGGSGDGSATCGRPICQCITPPALTCIQRQCPAHPFLFQPQSQAQPQPQATPTVPDERRACPALNCNPRCRKILGPDGCHACQCAPPRLPVITIPILVQPIIPTQRRQEGPCVMPRCASSCQRVISQVTGCPVCDCSALGESELLQQKVQ